MQVDALIAASRFAEAGHLLARGLSREPENYSLLCLMGQVLDQQGHWKEALENVQRAVAIDPDIAWGHRIHSIILCGRLRGQESIRSAEVAVRLSPNDPLCWHTLASAELEFSHLKNARAAAEHLRELAPGWYLSHQLLALIALKDGRKADAEMHCRRELELNPNSSDGINNLGVVMLNQRRSVEAVATFHQAAKLDPADPTARRNLDLAYRKYLPRFGIGVAGAFVLIRAITALGVFIGLFNTLIGLVAVAAAVGAGYYAFRLFRFYRMPREVRNYFLLLSYSRREASRRDTCMLIWVLALIAAGLWWVVVYLNLDLFESWTRVQVISPSAGLLLIAGIAATIHWFIRERK
ncbi:MAG: tetratricopeptide repeat protein [Pyrinomonadaceae bacterium]